LVGITEAQYGAGRSNQQDVLQAGLELSRLDDRQTRIQTAEDTARAELAKWIGEPALQPLTEGLPDLPGLPTLGDLEARIPGHPSIGVENARVAANRLAERVAREQYKPGWSLDVTYGQRGGNNPDGHNRPDFLSATVVMDMPLFTGKRQDRRLAASEQERLAATYARDDRLRELRRMLQSEYARWRRLGERVAHYQARLIPEAQANVEAALLAYQSRVTEFITLMRARITDLDTRLQALRLRVDRAKAQARLLYIVGEKS
jgi:outer membrane protein TolC